MRLCHRATVAVAQVLGLALLIAMPPAEAARAPHEIEDSNSLVMSAEIALQRDDCGRAAQSYATATLRLADAHLAARAVEVALSCGQFEAAEVAVGRWRRLLPVDPVALHAAVRIELGLYKIDEARALFQQWLRVAAPTTKGGAVEELRQLAEQAGNAATYAMVRELRDRALQSRDAQEALAELAFDDWNYQSALQYAQGALATGSPTAEQRGTSEALIAHANAGLSQADAAIAAANAARSASPQEQSFVLADVLQVLGREADARRALETLRDNAALGSQAERRLGLLAFNRGDYDGADQIFSGLLKDNESSAVAVFYLGAIAERRDDPATALRAYGLLNGTPLDAAARARTAQILYRQNEHSEALAVLQPADDAGVATRLEAEMAQAQLLSICGASKEALARIDDTLDRFPSHPDLQYQKSILLERAGRTDAAISGLEGLYRARARDASIGNALGFILVDHSRELPRAERLINSALQSEPDNPAILDSLGWLQFRRGAARAALPLLERAFRLDQDGDIGAHWGEVLWAVGEKSQARAIWMRALNADPDNEAVKAALSRAGVPPPGAAGAGTSI